ncbi:MAG: alpha/beta fold hydrolase [Trueperaceae bacterium]|nr:alpha/beta fold hydrolase [Trueperaceae bacterium]
MALVHACFDRNGHVIVPEIVLGSDERQLRPVILLHAFPLHAGMWARQVAAIERSGGLAVALDAPGFGESGLSSRVSDMETLADGVFEVWRGLKLPPAVIVGLSMGGYAALRAVQRHPEMVRALVLASTKAEADSEEARENRYRQATQVLEEGSEVLLDMQTSFLNDPDEHPDVAEMIRSARPEAVAAALRGMAIRPSSVRFLEEIRVPTLVIAGEDDPLTPPETMKTLAEGIPEARFETLNAKHLSNIGAADDFNALLTSFIERFR